MKERLPKKIYKAIRKTIDEGVSMDPSIADVVANAMKDWALERGATHYCHWFHPMTGSTAEKHDSFISPVGDGTTIMEFSGKELIQGEPDASSFPSGGLRATFEARGYTAWDCTSPVFIKEDGSNVTLFIPCAFCSYTSEALDKKTPLLRSMAAVEKQALRVLRALGNTTSARVVTNLGAEQEYFLIDQRFVEERLDLVLAGRTLFGAPSPRGQELDDHYFGSLHERIATFMNDLNNELWKLGVSATTQHNEVAPAQYEVAPIYSTVNVATDANQLTMECLQKVARAHGFLCLLHEKPFAGVNGSGKHHNYGISTNDGINLLDPGHTPHENMVFLAILFGVISGVDQYADLLRASVASSGNDHRLGANEAPPAIISVFLGEQLNDIFEQIAKGGAKRSKKGGTIELGATTLPPLPKDNTDRNRTSPFAFTGNRFEFRMPGSSISPAGACFVLNTIVAEGLCGIADKLEKARNPEKELQKVLQGIAKESGKVIFNGDNYSEDWVKEAEKRGLPNLKNTPTALATVMKKANVDLFKKHKVLTRAELKARVEILFENYGTTIGIEGKTTANIAKRQILPAALDAARSLADSAASITAAGANATVAAESLDEVVAHAESLKANIAALEAAIAVAGEIEDAEKAGFSYREKVVPAMDAVRADADALEQLVDADLWPMPTYAEMLFKR
jgi:glutamine synthetase